MKEKVLDSFNKKQGVLYKASLLLFFMKGHITMDDFTKFIQALGVMGEMTAIFYNTLLRAGLSEDVAVTLSAKMVGEFIQIIGKTGKENNNDNETE